MMRNLVSLGPVADLQNVAELVERAFGESRNGHSETAPKTWSLPVDVYERGDKLVIKAAVPGSKPEDVEISIEDGMLTISGETKSEFEETDKFYRREYRYGSFKRTIRLPEDIDVENVLAQFENGFIKVTLPRVEPAKPKSYKIPIQHLGEPEVEVASVASARTKSKK